ETDDRSVDHRPAWWASSRAPPGSAGRGAKVLVEEVKHLVPAIDCLLGPVIWAVMRKKRVAGAVITVELVVLAKPLKLCLVTVDVIRRRVRVFIAEEAEDRAIDPSGQIVRCHRLALGQP